MENKTMSAGLKKVIDETKKEIQPLLELLGEQGKDNYITYYSILREYKDQKMRKFVALVLLNCDNVNPDGVFAAIDLIG
jgi:hypothetical protein